MATSKRNGALLLLGLVIGWYVAEKGWHRHLFYVTVIAALVLAIWRL